MATEKPGAPPALANTMKGAALSAFAVFSIASVIGAQVDPPGTRSPLEGRWTDGTVVYDVRAERLTVWESADPSERQTGSIRVRGDRMTIDLDGERETLTFAVRGDRLLVSDADGATETLRRVAETETAKPESEPQAGGEAVAAITEWAPQRCFDEHGFRDAAGRPMEVFQMNVPRGWTFTGGVTWNLQHTSPVYLTRTQLLVPAKIAFRVTSADRRSALEVYPEEHFADLTQSPAGRMGQFPPGSNYAGSISLPVATPQAFVRSFVLPRQRGLDPRSIRVVDERPLPEVAARFDREIALLDRIAGAAGAGRLENRAAAVTVDYEADGVAMRETFLCDLTYARTPGITLWWPRFSASGRAPRARFDDLQPVFLAMLGSIEGNPRWLLRYLKVSDQNWQGVAETDAVLHRLDREIADHRAQTNVEIQRQCYPRLAPYWYYEGPDGRRHYGSTELDHQIHTESGAIRSGRSLPVEPGWHPMQEVVREPGERKRG